MKTQYCHQVAKFYNDVIDIIIVATWVIFCPTSWFSYHNIVVVN